MPTAKELREKLVEKQNALQLVFEEARNDSGEYDFKRVKCLGEEVKGSSAVAEKVREMNAELDGIAQEVEAIEAAEKVANDQRRREERLNRPPIGGGGDEGRRQSQLKALGDVVVGTDQFKEWQKNAKSAGGVTIQLPDLYPSDILAKGVLEETIGSKTLFQTGAGWAPESIRIPGMVEAVTRPIQLLDIIPVGQTGMEQIVYMEETTRTHAAAETAEGGPFSESTFALTEQSSPVRKITDSLPVTDDQLEDVPQAQGYINNRLTFGLRQRLDGQVLVGNGTPPNLTGIKNTPNIQTQARGTDPVPDAFFKAMTKVRLNGRAVPTHHVMHPQNWEGVRLLRTADGVYIWGNPSQAGPERMWGLPIIQQDADAAGTGYVGSFQSSWISLFERRGVDVQLGYTGTQFTEGKRTVRADMRWAFVVFRPPAFCTVTGL